MSMKNIRNEWKYSTLSVSVCMLLALSAVSFAGENKGLKPGDSVPGFSLKDYSGKTHSLSDYKGKIVVLQFSSQECPWSRAADPGISDLQKDYAKKGVVVLGIDSHKDTLPDAIESYAKENGLSFPILKDSKNVYADELHASATPEFFVIDGNARLAYHGAFDNRKSPEDKGNKNYVRDALDAVIAGKSPAVSEVKAWGCSIKRVKK